MQQLHNGDYPQLDNDGHSYEEKFQANSENEILISASDNLSNSLKRETFRKNRWAWTGFTDKTLWDWLQFVASIAASIALPIIFTIYTAQQQETAEKNRKQEQETAVENRRQEQEIATDNQHHEILTDYLDDMTELMLDEDLGQTSSNQQAGLIASARTQNTLRQLDGKRKGQLLKFLHEANLVGHQCQTDVRTLQAIDCRKAIVNLEGAKLENIAIESPIRLQGIDLTKALLAEANLPRIDLTKAEMQEVDLHDANLSGALLTDSQVERANLEGITLVDAVLPRANFSSTDLRNADLRGADLRQAILSNARLQGAKLSNTNLQEANLGGADLTGANLEGADLKGAKYNTATKFPEGFDPDGQGMKGIFQES